MLSNSQLITFGVALLIPELAMLAMIWRQDAHRPSKAVVRHTIRQGGRPRSE